MRKGVKNDIISIGNSGLANTCPCGDGCKCTDCGSGNCAGSFGEGYNGITGVEGTAI